MPEWITYRLSDFLLFSPRTYYRMFELYHQQIWPVQLVIIGIAGALLVIFRGANQQRARALAGLIGLCWIWVAVAFHLQRYAQINWAARYFAILFFLQAALLVWYGVIRPRIAFDKPATPNWLAAAALFLALVLEGVAGLAGGRSWRQLEFAGFTPDATAIATLLILSLARLGAPRLLMVVPILWCVIGGATLWALGSVEAWVVLLAGVTGLIAAIRIPSGRRRISAAVTS